MESTRQTRVSKQIHKDLSEIINSMNNTLAPGKMLTVTKAKITPDLGLVKVNISVFPSTGSEAIVENLNEKKSSVRYELGKKLRHQLKKIPALKFYLDDSLDYIDNIDNILND
jgi:ribosome-binding factor A